MNAKNRLVPLDIFRSIAALSVVLFHYTTKYREIFGHSYSSDYDFSYGYLGVHFFFLISGFVIFMTVIHCKSVADFLYKRFTRLYPVFWLCLIVTFFSMVVFGFPKRTPYYSNLGFNLTMIPNFFGRITIDGAYWSLLPEFFFYITMAILMATKQIEKVLFWGVILLTIGWINKFLMPLPVRLNMILSTSYFPLFFAGILFYKIRVEEMGRNKKWIIHTLVSASLISACIGVSSNSERIIVSVMFLLFYLFSFRLLDWMDNKFLIFIGRISYPLYLIHQNLGYMIMNYCKTWLSNYPAFLLIAIPIIFSLVLATVIHKYFEVPLIAKLRHLSYKTQKGSK